MMNPCCAKSTEFKQVLYGSSLQCTQNNTTSSGWSVLPGVAGVVRRTKVWGRHNLGEFRRHSSTELTVETRPGSLGSHFNLDSSCDSTAKHLLCMSY